MNRRRFSALGLAAAIAAIPRQALAQSAVPDAAGYQIATINDGLLAVRHGGTARAGLGVDDDTQFQVASCLKTVTSLAVLTLVRDGRLALDAPVNQTLKRWQLPRLRGDAATFAALMSHTAGKSVHGFGGYGPSEDLPDLFEILSGQTPANFDAVRAGLRLFGGFRRHPESAAAGLWATASDLAKILQAVLDSLRRGRHAILPLELATRMISPLSQQSRLGVFVERDRVIWHEGRNFGFDAIMVAELATGRIRAAVVNLNGAIERYAQELLPR